MGTRTGLGRVTTGLFGWRWPVVVIGLVVTSGCAEVGDADAGEDEVAIGGTAVIAGPVDLGNLNPLVAVEATTQEFVRDALFLPLLRMGPDMRPEPGLAESWELAGDTLVTFTLRDDVLWHDSTPTTAADVAFTFRAVKDPETGFPDPVRFAAWDSVEVVDTRTVRFHVRPGPDPLFGWTLTAIAPVHLLADVPPADMAQAAFNRDPVGNGPFRFVSWSANDRVVLEANQDYPVALGGRPNVDRLVYRVIPESTARVAELVSGGVDLAFGYPVSDLAQLSGGLSAVETDARQVSFVAWNARRPPLDDQRVRRALSMAIDRREIVTLLRAGHGSVAVSTVPPSHWAFNADLRPVPFDTAGARALLEEAGLADSDGDGVLELADGEPFSIEIKFPGQDTNFRSSSEMVRSDLAAIGVDARPLGLEGGTLIGDVTSPERRFDGVMLSLEIEMRPNLRDLFHSGSMDGPLQLSGYADPDLDAAIDALAQATDRDAERGHWLRAQELLARDQPWTFLYYFPNLAGVSQRLRGVEMDLRGRLVSVADWWLEGGAAESAEVDGADADAAG
ncbi:MAG: ABC transporter substrate-binding protein [Gemmatimonadota bacterium]